MWRNITNILLMRSCVKCICNVKHCIMFENLLKEFWIPLNLWIHKYLYQRVTRTYNSFWKKCTHFMNIKGRSTNVTSTTSTYIWPYNNIEIHHIFQVLPRKQVHRAPRYPTANLECARSLCWSWMCRLWPWPSMPPVMSCDHEKEK